MPTPVYSPLLATPGKSGMGMAYESVSRVLVRGDVVVSIDDRYGIAGEITRGRPLISHPGARTGSGVSRRSGDPSTGFEESDTETR